MVNLHWPQVILSLLASSFRNPDTERPTTKSIAIVGAGSGGLAALKTLLYDLPQHVTEGWDIVLYEQRRDVGGVWLEDPIIPHPPKLPETPLYPLLHTNTPHPTMTYIEFPFPPNTSLFPSHEFVRDYHSQYATYYNLRKNILFHHEVISTAWIGNSSFGYWDVIIRKSDGNSFRRRFDHLIVASGHNHYPYSPSWNGTEAWLARSPKREILHSIFYRHPEKYRGKTPLLVGAGASGRDAAQQITSFANKTFLSIKNDSFWQQLPLETIAIKKPGISHFTSDSIVFEDGSEERDIDSVLLCTGYELRIPFLTRGGALLNDPLAHSRNHSSLLTTNFRYLFPLHQHILSLSSAFPPTALSFVGLPIGISNAPSDIAQSLLIAHTIANPSLLPPRRALLEDLTRREEALEARGLDPYRIGHRLIGDDDLAQDYQDEIVQWLKEKGALPNDGVPFVEEWRRFARRNLWEIRKAWTRVEQQGETSKWLAGVKSEKDWDGLMRKLVRWDRKEQKAGTKEEDRWIPEP